MNNNKLSKYGFDNYFSHQYNSKNTSDAVARVIAHKGDLYETINDNGVAIAKVMGRFIHQANANKDYPVVGDFITYQEIKGADLVKITSVLKRKNSFSRKMPISGGRKLYKGVIDGGVTEEQVIAANIDYAMILCGLDKNFNISRIERYLLLAKRSDLNAIVVLTKLDLCSNYNKYINIVKEIASDISVHAVSSLTGDGMSKIAQYIKPQNTITLLGSSGVGKSTLLNAVFNNEVQKTNIVSSHSGKGKHTTTHRQMFIHPNGCMIIDTPGIKEVQLWADLDDLRLIFGDIIELEICCKYSNCSHKNEAGCAVNSALETGELSLERYKRYIKIRKEINRLNERKQEHRKRFSSKKR